MNYLKYFVLTIQRYYPGRADDIIAQTNKNYQLVSKDSRFSFTSKNPIDRRLDFSAYFLALIMTLDRNGESFEKIREICLKITIDFVQPKNAFQRFTKKLIPKLTHTWLGQTLIKKFHERVSVNSNPGGFVANIITDRDKTYDLGYGVDIIECGICKLFNKHNYHKYASILCEVDEITSALAGLELIRTGTIARGAKKCDFRFRRVRS